MMPSVRKKVNKCLYRISSFYEKRIDTAYKKTKQLITDIRTKQLKQKIFKPMEIYGLSKADTESVL